MDETRYAGLVGRLESEAFENPVAFRNKVLLLSGFAYLALALTLVVLTGLGVGLVWLIRNSHNLWVMVKLGLVGLGLLGILFTVLRAFMARIPEPEGREVTREEAPQLFELIDRVRAKLDGPPLHRVVIDNSYNAAIAQVPRFGLFGGHRNHLIIGLPYLFGVPTREMIATLAHEYGHLVGADGKLGAWVYRQRRTFGALMERVDNGGGWIDGLLRAGLGRLAPYFNAYTFVLSRQNEYLADAAASRVAGAGVNAAGLCRDELLGRWFAQDFWAGVFAAQGEREQPAFMPYASLRTAFAAAYPDWNTHERLSQALKRRSDLHDTHPCLRERLDAIEQSPTLPPLVEKSAADALLGRFALTLAHEFDDAWWKEERSDWLARYQENVQARQRVATLGVRTPESLNAMELFDYAQALATLRRPADALPPLARLLARPDGPYPRARLLQGQLLLETGDRRGLEELKLAAREDPKQAEASARAGYAFLAEREGHEAAVAWATEVMQQEG